MCRTSFLEGPFSQSANPAELALAILVLLEYKHGFALVDHWLLIVGLIACKLSWSIAMPQLQVIA